MQELKYYCKLALGVFITVAVLCYCYWAYTKVATATYWNERDKREAIKAHLEVASYAMSIIPEETRKNYIDAVKVHFEEEEEIEEKDIYKALCLELPKKEEKKEEEGGEE
jgi:hypothetical protein